MEKIFELIDTVTSKKLLFAESDQRKWNQMMATYSYTVNDLLSKECPTEISLEKFKMGLLTGEKQVSAICQEKIQYAFRPIREYAKAFASLNDINISDLNDDELAVLGGTFSPSTKINNGELAPTTNIIADSTGSEIWDRIINAVGIEISAILRILDMETANVKLIAKTITKYLYEDAGLIGAALVVADFGPHIYQNSKTINMDSNMLQRAV